MKKTILTLTLALLAPLALQAQTIIQEYGTDPGREQLLFPTGGASVTDNPTNFLVTGTGNFQSAASNSGFSFDTTLWDLTQGLSVTGVQQSASNQATILQLRLGDSGFTNWVGYNLDVTTWSNDGTTFATITSASALDSPDQIGGSFTLGIDNVESVNFIVQGGVTTEFGLLVQDFGVEVVPEPTSAALVAVGFAGLLLRRRCA